jgi:hypothetical protein
MGTEGGTIRMLPPSFSPATRSHSDILITNHKNDSGVKHMTKETSLKKPSTINRSSL